MSPWSLSRAPGSPRYLSVVIRGLPAKTEGEDVSDHIQSLVSCRVHKLGPVVPDHYRGGCSTTATLGVQSNDGGQSILDLLDWSSFLGQPEYPILLDRDFYGLTTVAEEKDSSLDVCFVHGLGGHAFNSWTYSDTRTTSMWPRDFLPQRFPREGIRARILTYGHRSSVFQNADARATIRTAAEELLSHLIAHRAKEPERPIYFACHSLGGLIVCEALINCLSNDAGFAVKKREYETLFSGSGNCLVKGIIFFGCPFRGSSQANYIYPFIKLLSDQYFWPVNKDLVKSLKNRDIGVAQIVGRFNRVRKSNKIPLLICCETDPVVGTSLTTTRDSAMGVFDRDVAPIQINGNHHEMVKFSHRDDPSYRTLESRIVQMITSQSQEVALSVGSPSSPRQDTQGSSRRSPRDIPGRRATIPTVTAESGTSTLQSRPTFPRLPDTAGPQNLSMLDHTKFSRLSMFDTVFIVDDTGSMQKSVSLRHPDWPDRWSDMNKALELIADVAAQYDQDGVDLLFLKNTQIKAFGLRNGSQVLAKLRAINLSDPICGGGTFFHKQLRKAIEPCLAKYEEYNRNRVSDPSVDLPKPLNLIVLTDGEADDEEEVEEYLVETARKLDQLGAPKNHIGVQFVQVGDDVEAAEYLRRLDDDLKTLHQNADGKSIRDIVDTTPFNPDADDNVLKMVLGAVTKRLDEMENILPVADNSDDEE